MKEFHLYVFYPNSKKQRYFKNHYAVMQADLRRFSSHRHVSAFRPFKTNYAREVQPVSLLGELYFELLSMCKINTTKNKINLVADGFLFWLVCKLKR